MLQLCQNKALMDSKKEAAFMSHLLGNWETLSKSFANCNSCCLLASAWLKIESMPKR